MNPREKLAAARKALQDLVAKAETDGITDDLQGQLDAAKAEVEAVLAQVKAADDQTAALAPFKGLLDGGEPAFVAGNEGELVPLAGRGAVAQERPKSMGAQFAAGIKDWLSSYPSGHPQPGSSIISPTVGVKGLLTSGDPQEGPQAGALVRPEWQGLRDDWMTRFFRPLTILDLVSRATTQTDRVEWARVKTITPDPQYYAQATSVADGLIASDATIEFEVVDVNVQNIADAITVTDQALADVGGVLSSMIDNVLDAGITRKVEDELLMGSGSPGQLEGLFNTDGVLEEEFDTDIVRTVRKARRKLRYVGRAVANAVVLNPEDNEDLDLMQDGQQRYYGAGPFGPPNSPSTLWGLTRIESEIVPRGLCIIGDWSKLYLIDRQQTTIQAANQHKDYFMRNLVQVKATWRGAAANYQPSAFVIAETRSGGS